MKCFPELTYAVYLDGELPTAEIQEVQSHLSECATCRNVVQNLRDENQLLMRVLYESFEREAGTSPVEARSSNLQLIEMAAGLLSAATMVQALFGWWSRIEWGPLAWVNPFNISAQLNLFFAVIFSFLEPGGSMFQSLINILSLVSFGVLLVVAVRWILRRPRTVNLFALLILLFFFPLSTFAIQVRHGQRMTVPGDETINDTLLALGDAVSIDGTVTGDLIAFARVVTVNGTVNGEVICFSQNLDVNGNVGGNVHFGGQMFNIRGRVPRNVHFFGQRLYLHSDGQVEGDLSFFGGEADLQGLVGRDVSIFGGSIDARGKIGRNLYTRAGRLTVWAPAHIGGNLTARVNDKKKVQIDRGATIVGKTDIIIAKRNRYLTTRFYIWQGLQLVAAFVAGLVLFWLFPVLFGARLDTSGALLRTAGLGFLVAVITPVAVVVAAITLVGIPVAVLGLLVWMVGMYTAKILVAVFLGEAIMQRPSVHLRSFAPLLLVGLAACRTSHDESHKSFVFNIDFRAPESSIVENKGLTGESPTGC